MGMGELASVTLHGNQFHASLSFDMAGYDMEDAIEAHIAGALGNCQIDGIVIHCAFECIALPDSRLTWFSGWPWRRRTHADRHNIKLDRPPLRKPAVYNVNATNFDLTLTKQVALCAFSKRLSLTSR
jgi:hypothetical protein